jgi:hypothetical protein
MAEETPRAPIAPRQAQKPPRLVGCPLAKPRAPFLPNEPHPHGWLTKHHGQRPHSLVTTDEEK